MRKITGYIFIIFSLVISSYGFYKTWSNDKLIFLGEKTIGKIDSVSEIEDYYGNILIFHGSFPLNGKNIYFKNSYSSSEKRYNIGDKVEVYYDLKEPSNNVIFSFSEATIYIVPILFAIVFFIVGYQFAFKKN